MIPRLQSNSFISKFKHTTTGLLTVDVTTLRPHNYDMIESYIQFLDKTGKICLVLFIHLVS